jgi:hypothetical protein
MSKFDNLNDPNYNDFRAGGEAFFYPKLNPVGERTGRALEAYNAGLEHAAKCQDQTDEENYE